MTTAYVFIDLLTKLILHNCPRLHLIAFALSVAGFLFLKIILGNVARGVTPVPISNTEVKPSEVDGTVVVRLRESRKLPG